MFDAEAFLAAIDQYEHIVIAGHVSPDGDAVGACFAMALFVRSRGKIPVVLLGAYPPYYDCLRGREFVWQGDWSDVPCEMFIALDCGGKERLAAALPVFERAKLTVNIDHHQSNDGYGDMNAVDAGCSSACELLYGILREAGALDTEMGEALFAGIACDTGGFRHASAHASTFEAAAALMRLGVNGSKIQRHMLYTHSQAATRILAAALGAAQFAENAPVAYVSLTLADMECACAASFDLDGIVDRLLDIEGAAAAVLVSERAGGVCKISLRSRGLDMNEIASGFGGGGHRRAAGAAVCGAAEAVTTQVILACEREWAAYAVQNKRD